MTYEEAVQVVSSALKFGMNPSLDPITALCEVLGNPQRSFRCIQVTGTNGKTSTVRMIAALLAGEGASTGLYVSPHLIEYTERIEINGKVISGELFARGISETVRAARQADLEPTEFEMLTAAALWIFAEAGVEWVVLECGMGGRWDATSVVNPDVAVITGVGLDHVDILGDTIEVIAAEKAAIIKPGSTAVLAAGIPAQEVFENRASLVAADVVHARRADSLPVDILPKSMPAYQLQNLATALDVVTIALGHTPSRAVVERALAGLLIPGRFEILQDDPLLVIDAAHNPQSAHVLAEEIHRRFLTGDGICSKRANGPVHLTQIVLLLGVLADKDARGIISELCPLFDRVVVTASSSPRAIPAQELARLVEEVTGISPEVTESVEEAHALLLDEPVIATGSITVAGEVRDIWC